MSTTVHARFNLRWTTRSEVFVLYAANPSVWHWGLDI